MIYSTNFDASVVANMSINDLEKIMNCLDSIVHLGERISLTRSNREKELFIYAIEDTILNIKDIIDKNS